MKTTPPTKTLTCLFTAKPPPEGVFEREQPLLDMPRIPTGLALKDIWIPAKL